MEYLAQVPPIERCNATKFIFAAIFQNQHWPKWKIEVRGCRILGGPRLRVKSSCLSGLQVEKNAVVESWLANRLPNQYELARIASQKWQNYVAINPLLIRY